MIVARSARWLLAGAAGALDRGVLLFGLAVKPHPNVVEADRAGLTAYIARGKVRHRRH